MTSHNFSLLLLPHPNILLSLFTLDFFSGSCPHFEKCFEGSLVVCIWARARTSSLFLLFWVTSVCGCATKKILIHICLIVGDNSFYYCGICSHPRFPRSRTDDGIKEGLSKYFRASPLFGGDINHFPTVWRRMTIVYFNRKPREKNNPFG